MVEEGEEDGGIEGDTEEDGVPGTGGAIVTLPGQGTAATVVGATGALSTLAAEGASIATIASEGEITGGSPPSIGKIVFSVW